MKVHELFDKNDDNYVNTNKLVKVEGGVARKLDDVVGEKVKKDGDVFSNSFRNGDYVWHDAIIYTGSPGLAHGIKITCPIPLGNISGLIDLKGIHYPTQGTVGLFIYFDANPSNISFCSATKYGSYQPEIKMGIENGKIFIWLQKWAYPVLCGSYFCYYSVPNSFSLERWVVEDAPLPETATSVVTATYK